METEETNNNPKQNLGIITIKKDIPAIHCVPQGFLKEPENLEKLLKVLTRGRTIESITPKPLVTEYEVVLSGGELIQSKAEPIKANSEDAIRIVVTESKAYLMKLALSCKGNVQKPRENIDTLIKRLSKGGAITGRKSQITKEETPNERYEIEFDYLLDLDVSEAEGERFRKRINFLERRVTEETNFILTLLASDPTLLEKPKVKDYLEGEKIPFDIFLKNSIHTKRDNYLAELYDIIEKDVRVTKEQIESDMKKEFIVGSRAICMYLLRRQFAGYHEVGSSSAIGKVLGGKNHATVLLACANFNKHGKSFPFELTGDIKTDYGNAKALYLYASPNSHYARVLKKNS